MNRVGFPAPIGYLRGVHPAGDDAELLRRERDLYRRLLDLGQQEEMEPFLRDALAMVVELTGSSQGYIELHDPESGDEWSIAHAFSEAQVADVRAAISHGIVGATLAAGRTLLTTSAHDDARFSGFDSVRMGRIEAVLCSPIGDAPALGAVYLRRATAGPFADDDRERVELFARHLRPSAERLVLQRRARERGDATRPWREKLRAEGIVGRSAALAAALKQAALVAPLDVAVLLTGASGTGKTQLARVIHDNSPRAAAPFLEVNCSTLPREHMEADLFGWAKDSHSRAFEAKEGKVGAARGGTLFLDEIGELPIDLQAKLLQLLQSKTYYPFLAEQPKQADVRVLAATNVDLDQAVREHRFREDLLFRLRVIPIRMPSLAERREDIAALAEFACNAACERHGLAALRLSPNALRALEAAEWPGNVRDLAHAIERAAIYAQGDGRLFIEPRDLFPDTAPAAAAEPDDTFQRSTRRFQETLLRRTLEETEWNVSETARRLDLTRTHIYNLVRAFGIERV